MIFNEDSHKMKMIFLASYGINLRIQILRKNLSLSGYMCKMSSYLKQMINNLYIIFVLTIWLLKQSRQKFV